MVIETEVKEMKKLMRAFLSLPILQHKKIKGEVE